MRVLIFHAYLLRGTGSNIYNLELARSLVGLGHEVHLFCQDPAPEEFGFVDAVGRWRDGKLQVEVARRPVRCTAYVPDIGGLLPVYVADPYEGFEVRTYPQLTDAEIERYLAANVAAVRDVAAAVRPAAALANHLVMGPVILGRALAGRAGYAVKIHGSALEYVVRPHPDRFLPYAREGLAGASAVLCGSRHVAESLWEVAGVPGLPARTRLLPPGVDISVFRPRPPAQARDRLRVVADQLQGNQAGWGGEAGAAEALRAADPVRDRIVSYVGKLTTWKGVDLLIAAWPLVAARVPDARLIFAGFGTFRGPLGEMARSLAAGDLTGARDIARRGLEMQGGQPGELHYLAAFFDSLRGAERDQYLAAAARGMERVHFTGRIEHSEIHDIMSASEAVVVPSTFPEAFGMVAAEAACCGALPVAAAHSGLREVSALLAPALSRQQAALLSFPLGAGAVRELGGRLASWLLLPEPAARRARASLAELAASRFGWQQIAEGVIAAGQGRLADLPLVPEAALTSWSG